MAGTRAGKRRVCGGTGPRSRFFHPRASSEGPTGGVRGHREGFRAPRRGAGWGESPPDPWWESTRVNARSPGASSRRASVRSRPARLEKGRRWGSTAPVKGPSAAVWRMEKLFRLWDFTPHCRFIAFLSYSTRATCLRTNAYPRFLGSLVHSGDVSRRGCPGVSEGIVKRSPRPAPGRTPRRNAHRRRREK